MAKRLEIPVISSLGNPVPIAVCSDVVPASLLFGMPCWTRSNTFALGSSKRTAGV
jgi:hypothetical protein